MPSASCPPPAAEVRVAEVRIAKMRVTEVGAADDVHDPDRWLAWLAWLVIAFALLQVLLFGFGRDHAAHALVGEAVLRGEMPYRDAWDPSAPGIFLLHAAVQGLLGKSMLALRLVEIGGLLVLVFCFRSLGANAFGSPTAGLVGAAIAALVHAQLEFVHTGQPETIAGFFTAGALAVTLRFDRSVQRQATLLGLLLGGLLLFEPSLAPVGLVCGAHLVRRLQITRGGPAAVAPALITLLCALSPALACLLWFHSRGATPELWWTLTDWAAIRAEAAAAGRTAPELFYTASVEALVGASSLVAVGLVAALLQRPSYAREREALFLVFGVLSVQLASIALEATFAPHHFGATLPLLALVGGLGWYKLWRRLLPTGPSGWFALAAFAVVVGSMRGPTQDLPQGFWQRSALRLGYLLRVGPLSTRDELDRQLSTHGDYDLAATRRLAQHLNQELSPGDTLHVSVDEPLVYWLTSAHAASPFLRGPSTLVPTKAGAASPESAPFAPPLPPTLQASLEALRPEYVLRSAAGVSDEPARSGHESPRTTLAPARPPVAPSPPSHGPTSDDAPSTRATADRPPGVAAHDGETRWLEAHYTPKTTLDGFTLYERRREP